MKNKLRTVHIGGIAWNYAVSKGEVRVYRPGTKLICCRIPVDDVRERGVQPKFVRAYIINQNIPMSK